MHRDTNFFQGTHQGFQSVRKRNGRSGIGQQEGAGNQHQDSGYHENGAFYTVHGNHNAPPLYQHPAFPGKEQVQHTGKHQNHNQGFHAAQNGFQRDGGSANDARQENKHHAIGNPALREKKGNDINHHDNQLRPGIQPVNGRISREKLSEGNVFQHGFIPSFSCFRTFMAWSMVYTLSTFNPRSRRCRKIWVT